MDNQATNIKDNHRQKQITLANNIKQIVRVFTSRVLSEKLSNNEVFSPSLAWRAQYKAKNKVEMEW